MNFKQTYGLHRLSSAQAGMRLFRTDSAIANTTIINFLTNMWPWRNVSFFVEFRNNFGCNSFNSYDEPYNIGSEQCDNNVFAIAEFRNSERKLIKKISR